MQTKLFKIKEAARFLDITTATLRYYEEYGIISPDYVDPETGYRYYSAYNLSSVSYFLLLRQSGVTMAQLKDIVDHNIDAQIIHKALEERKHIIESTIRIAEIYLQPEGCYRIEEVSYPSGNYCVLNEVAPNIETLFYDFYKFMSDCISDGLIMNKPIISFIEFPTIIPEFYNITSAIHIRVKEGHGFKTVPYPNIKGISIFYKGVYDNIHIAYKKLSEYAKEHNLPLKGNSFEIYHSTTNIKKGSDAFITEVVFPYKD